MVHFRFKRRRKGNLTVEEKSELKSRFLKEMNYYSGRIILSKELTCTRDLTVISSRGTSMPTSMHLHTEARKLKPRK